MFQLQLENVEYLDPLYTAGLRDLKVREMDEKKILSLREKYKWGPQRLAVYFLREEEKSISSTTIWRVLKKHKVKSIKRYRKQKDFK